MDLGVSSNNPFLIFDFEIFGAFLPGGHQRRTSSKERPWKTQGFGPNCLILGFLLGFLILGLL